MTHSRLLSATGMGTWGSGNLGTRDVYVICDSCEQNRGFPRNWSESERERASRERHEWNEDPTNTSRAGSRSAAENSKNSYERAPSVRLDFHFQPPGR